MKTIPKITAILETTNVTVRALFEDEKDKQRKVSLFSLEDDNRLFIGFVYEKPEGKRQIGDYAIYHEGGPAYIKKVWRDRFVNRK